MGREVWYAKRYGAFTSRSGNWWEIHICGLRTVWPTMQRAYSSHICAGHWDKEMEEHAAITGPKVGELIRLCINQATFPSRNAICSCFMRNELVCLYDLKINVHMLGFNSVFWLSCFLLYMLLSAISKKYEC